jgi:hypothetical protein
MSDLPEMTLAEAITAEITIKALMDEMKPLYDQARKIVQAGMDEQQQATGGTRFDGMVPGADGAVKAATVSLSAGEAAATVTDTRAFAAWVKDRYPSEIERTEIVRTVRPAWQTQFLASMTAAGVAVDTTTGEEVPGVAIKPARARTHSVRFAKDGRALVGEAWRGGLLGRVLPALAPAPAADDAADGGAA